MVPASSLHASLQRGEGHLVPRQLAGVVEHGVDGSQHGIGGQLVNRDPGRADRCRPPPIEVATNARRRRRSRQHEQPADAAAHGSLLHVRVGRHAQRDAHPFVDEGRVAERPAGSGDDGRKLPDVPRHETGPLGDR